MLISLSIENFRSIKDEQTLSMSGTKLQGPHEALPVEVPGAEDGLLPCALIYGANAAGKSNLVKALDQLRTLVRMPPPRPGKMRKLNYFPFALDKQSKTMPTKIEVSMIIDKVRYDFGFAYTESAFLEEWLYTYPEGRRRTVYERGEAGLTFGMGMKGPKRTLAELLRPDALFLTLASQHKDSDLSKVVKFFDKIFISEEPSINGAMIKSVFKDRSIDPRTIRFLDHIGTGVVNFNAVAAEMPEVQKRLLRDIFRIVRQQVEPEENESAEPDQIEVDEKDLRVELGHRTVDGEIEYLTADYESTGTQRLLVLLSFLFQVLDEGDIAIIDEIDASLHTFAVESIVSLFTDPNINTKGAQLIATTHDTNLLNPRRIRRDEIWFAEKSIGGATEYFSLAEVKSREFENFEAMYLSGRYGASSRPIDLSMFKHVGQARE